MVDGQPPQIGQAGEAGAEIVERDFDTGLAQRDESGNDVAAVTGEDTFGQLQTSREGGRSAPLSASAISTSSVPDSI